MARVKHVFPVQEIAGSLVPKGTVFRKKNYRDSSGRVIAEGETESYIIKHPRNLKSKPYSTNELTTHNNFREVSLQTVEILRRPVERAGWELRWQQQLKHGEAGAPIDPRTGARRIYKRLDAFIRACLLRELKKPL